MSTSPPPPVVLIMGVAASGKTTIGTLLATTLGWEFADADEFHPPANIAKMHAGIALTDADRAPWLAAIAAWIGARTQPAVVTCSALKRRYRDVLREGHPGVLLVDLVADRDLLVARLQGRRGHFFAPTLLDSQVRDLEPPQPDEHALVVDVSGAPDEAVRAVIAGLHLTASGA